MNRGDLMGDTLNVEKKCFIIRESTKGKFSICLVLDEFDSQKEANFMLAGLLTSKVTMQDLLNNFEKKPI
jgi:hypothetical protein